MKPDNSIFVSGVDLSSSSMPAEAKVASMVIVKSWDKDKSYRMDKFLAHGAVRVVPADRSGYCSASGVMVVYGPDNDDTAKVAAKRNAMLVLLTSAPSGKVKAAAPSRCVIMQMQADKPTSYKYVDGCVCKRQSMKSKWEPCDKSHAKKEAPKPEKSESKTSKADSKQSSKAQNPDNPK